MSDPTPRRYWATVGASAAVDEPECGTERRVVVSTPNESVPSERPASFRGKKSEHTPDEIDAFWTEERLDSAKGMPMPEIDDETWTDPEA